jgi:hypothetical protein
MANGDGDQPHERAAHWAEASLKPHLVAKFKVSNDPQFEERVTDIVGLYMSPPDKALVLCVDEKSHIPGARPDATGLAPQEGLGRNDEPTYPSGYCLHGCLKPSLRRA